MEMASGNMAEKKRLPTRASRGKRIHKLIGEEAEADEAFWNQDAWREDAEDEDYSTEEEVEDVIDADFDDEEEPDEEVHDEEEEQRRARPTRAAKKRRSVYKEPGMVQSMVPAKKKKHQQKQQDAPVPSTSSSGARVSGYVYEAPTVRESTARRTSESSELRRKVIEEAARQASKLKRQSSSKSIVRLTQAELLKEAVRTEVENTQSLNQLEQLEEEKKVDAVTPKAPFTGQVIRYHSRLGKPKTISFLNTNEYPEIFRQVKPKKAVIRNHKANHCVAHVAAMEDVVDVKQENGISTPHAQDAAPAKC